MRGNNQKLMKDVALQYISGQTTQKELATKLGVSQPTISRYVHFGSMEILAYYGIRDTDDHDTVHRKVLAFGSANPDEIWEVLTHYKRTRKLADFR